MLSAMGIRKRVQGPVFAGISPPNEAWVTKTIGVIRVNGGAGRSTLATNAAGEQSKRGAMVRQGRSGGTIAGTPCAGDC
jgi:Mrp family chromosome partitioning ATPase